MIRGMHPVYDLTGAELIVKDMLCVNDTYNYGECLTRGVTDGTDQGTVKSAGAGNGDVVGICNEGGTTAGSAVTKSGTVAAGTSERLKVIVNPFGVCRVEYDNSAQITWSANVDTTISMVTGGAGWVNAGGGWLWSLNTGELDWIVSSATADPTAFTVVTGNSTTSSTGILLQPAGGAVVPITLTADALKIDADALNVGVDGTNAIDCTVYNNWVYSTTYGTEMLVPATMNLAVRYANAVTAQRDNARVFADVCCFNSHVLQVD